MEKTKRLFYRLRLEFWDLVAALTSALAVVMFLISLGVEVGIRRLFGRGRAW